MEKLRVGAEDGSNQKSGTDPVLGDLMVDLAGQVVP